MTDQIDELTTADFNKQFRAAYRANPGGTANIGGKQIKLQLAKPGNIAQKASGGSAAGSKVMGSTPTQAPGIVQNKGIINKGVTPGNVPATAPAVRDLNTVAKATPTRPQGPPMPKASAPAAQSFFKPGAAAKIAAGGAQNVPAAPVVAQTPMAAPLPPRRPANIGTPSTFLQKQGIGVREEAMEEHHNKLIAAFDALVRKETGNAFAEAKKNDGNLANNYPPYDKVTRGDVIAGRLGKDEMGGKKKSMKEAEQGDDDGDDTKKMPRDYGESVENIAESKEVMQHRRDHDFHSDLHHYHRMKAEDAEYKGDEAAYDMHCKMASDHKKKADSHRKKLDAALDEKHKTKLEENNLATMSARFLDMFESKFPGRGVETPASPSKHVATKKGSVAPPVGQEPMHTIDADDSAMPKKKGSNPAHSTAAPFGSVPANKPPYTMDFPNPGTPGKGGESTPKFPNPGKPGGKAFKGPFPNPVSESLDEDWRDNPADRAAHLARLSGKTGVQPVAKKAVGSDTNKNPNRTPRGTRGPGSGRTKEDFDRPGKNSMNQAPVKKGKGNQRFHGMAVIKQHPDATDHEQIQMIHKRVSSDPTMTHRTYTMKDAQKLHAWAHTYKDQHTSDLSKYKEENYTPEELDQIFEYFEELPDTLEEKNWIAGAIKKPGALHKQLHVAAGKKIPAAKLAAAAHKGGKLGQRARLAQTLKKMHKEGFEVEFDENEIENIHSIYEDNMPATTDRTDPTENGSAPGRSDGYDRADRRVLTDNKNKK